MTVTHGTFKRYDLKAVLDELAEVIYKHEGRMSVAEAIGILELLKQQLIEEHAS